MNVFITMHQDQLSYDVLWSTLIRHNKHAHTKTDVLIYLLFIFYMYVG